MALTLEKVDKLDFTYVTKLVQRYLRTATLSPTVLVTYTAESAFTCYQHSDFRLALQ
jgi:hypothetical protein